MEGPFLGWPYNQQAPYNFGIYIQAPVFGNPDSRKGAGGHAQANTEKDVLRLQISMDDVLASANTRGSSAAINAKRQGSNYPIFGAENTLNLWLLL